MYKRQALNTVAAGRAGDHVHLVEDLLHLVYGGQLGLVQRLKVCLLYTSPVKNGTDKSVFLVAL